MKLQKMNGTKVEGTSIFFQNAYGETAYIASQGKKKIMYSLKLILIKYDDFYKIGTNQKTKY